MATAFNSKSAPCGKSENNDAPVQPNMRELALPLRIWPAIFLTGVGAGLLGGLLMKLLRLVEHLSFHYWQGNFLDGVAATTPERRLLVLIGAGVIAGCVLFTLHRFLPEKSSDLTEAIWRESGRLPERLTAIQAVLSIIIVGMGAAIGREQALKQAGSLVGARLSILNKLSPAQQKLLVACGAGAGMAAAYNVPFGGALFTIEVLLGTVSLSTVLPAFVTSFVATAVSWTLLPNQPTYRFPSMPANGSLLLFALVSGPIMGVAAVYFVRGIRWSKEHKPGRRAAAALPILFFTVLGLASIQFRNCWETVRMWFSLPSIRESAWGSCAG